MKRIVEEEVVVVRDGNGGESTASNAIWAVAMIIIVAIIAGAVYYSGIWKRVAGPASQKIDVDVSVPAAPSR